jgi:hypothetical protein
VFGNCGWPCEPQWATGTQAIARPGVKVTRRCKGCVAPRPAPRTALYRIIPHTSHHACTAPHRTCRRRENGHPATSKVGSPQAQLPFRIVGSQQPLLSEPQPAQAGGARQRQRAAVQLALLRDIEQRVLQALVPVGRWSRTVPHRHKLVSKRGQRHRRARQADEVRLQASLAEQPKLALAGGHCAERGSGCNTLGFLALCRQPGRCCVGSGGLEATTERCLPASTSC